MPKTSEPTQLDKFKDAARDLETNDDPELLRNKPAGMLRHKPVEEKPAE